jgi:hypothetical protein
MTRHTTTFMVALNAERNTANDNRAGDRARYSVFAARGAASEQQECENRHGFHRTSLLDRSGQILSTSRTESVDLSHKSPGLGVSSMHFSWRRMEPT